MSEEEKNSLYGFPVREEDKRRNPNGRVVDIQKLWSRSKEILHLDSLGYKGSEIARMLGIHPVTVSNTLNSTLGKEAQLTIRGNRDDEYEELREEVMDLTRKALKTYHEIFDSPSESAKLKKETADTVALELSGLRVPTKIDSRHVSTTLTAEEIDAFKRRGIEAAKANGSIVEVEGEGSRQDT